jgi:hypothetical protein
MILLTPDVCGHTLWVSMGWIADWLAARATTPVTTSDAGLNGIAACAEVVGVDSRRRRGGGCRGNGNRCQELGIK